MSPVSALRARIYWHVNKVVVVVVVVVVDGGGDDDEDGGGGGGGGDEDRDGGGGGDVAEVTPLITLLQQIFATSIRVFHDLEKIAKRNAKRNCKPSMQ